MIAFSKEKDRQVMCRPLRLWEIKALKTGAHASLFTGYHREGPMIIKVKINGKPKTWKRNPDKVSVPVKYGLYECSRIVYEYGVMADVNLFFVKIEE